jgi:hypothetical protein
MSDRHDIEGNNPAPQDRRLLLITKASAKFDAATEDIHDVVVGYWNARHETWVPAESGGNLTSKTLRVVKWAALPETDLTLSSLVDLKA